MGQEARAPALPQPLSYLARDGERVLTQKHNVPRDLEMGDLGRENERYATCWEQWSQPGWYCPSRDCPGWSPVGLNPWAFSCKSPAAAGRTGVAGNWETHLPFAERFNLVRGAVLPGPHSDAGADLFSHPRILHANHLVGTDGWCDPRGQPSPPAGCVHWPTPTSRDAGNVAWGCVKAAGAAWPSHWCFPRDTKPSWKDFPTVCQRKAGKAGRARRHQRFPLVLESHWSEGWVRPAGQQLVVGAARTSVCLCFPKQWRNKFHNQQRDPRGCFQCFGISRWNSKRGMKLN